MQKSARTIILIVIVSILVGCDSGRPHQMQHIYRLIAARCFDSADVELAKLNYADFRNKDDAAYYNLLRVKLDYLTDKPYLSDTLINNSIAQFKKSGNDTLLAESYFYKGCILYETKNIKEAVSSLIESEKVAERTSKLELRHKIIEKLANVYILERESDLALQYCEKNLKLSALSDNKNWLAYAHILYFDVYDMLHQKEKARESLKKAERYIKDVDDEEQGSIYASLAFYALPSDPTTAERYLETAKSKCANSFVYNAMSSLCAARGNKEKALAFADSAYALSQTTSNALACLQNKALLLSKYGEYEEAFATQLKVSDLKDSLVRERQTYDVKKIYAAKAQELREQKRRQGILYGVLFSLFVALAGIILAVYLKSGADKKRAEIYENQLLIDLYSKEIKRLRLSGKEKKEEVDNLQNKIEQLKRSQVEIQQRGKELYESLLSGGTAASWSKTDFQNCLEYYKLIDLAFVATLNNEYRDLTPRYQFFMVLCHQGKTEEDVSRIMGIGQSTIKSIKSRVKSKRII